MRRLICAFIVRIWQKQVFSWSGSYMPYIYSIFGPRQANLLLIAYASSEGSGEPAHPRSLARTFAARSYKQWIKRNLQTESQIRGPSEWLGMRGWNLSWRNAWRHKFAWRGSFHFFRFKSCIISSGHWFSHIFVSRSYSVLHVVTRTFLPFRHFVHFTLGKRELFSLVSVLYNNNNLSQLMRLWYLSHRRPAKAQASLRIRTVSPEPSLFAHLKCGSSRWRRFRPKKSDI